MNTDKLTRVIEINFFVKLPNKFCFSSKQFKIALFFLWVFTCFGYGHSISSIKNGEACQYITQKNISSFEFRRVNGEILSDNFQFGKGGIVKGYTHPNEYRWDCTRKGKIQLYDVNGNLTSTVIEGKRYADGTIAFLTGPTGLEFVPIQSIFYEIYYYSQLLIIALFPFLFFITLKSTIVRNIAFFSLILIGFLYFPYEFPSIFNHLSPSLIRLLLFSSISGMLIRLARGADKKFDKVDIYLIIFAMACVIWMAFFENTYWINTMLGRHWFYATNALIKNASFVLGSDFFPDAAVFKGKWYMAYGYGPIIFPLIFGAQIKFGVIVLVLTAIYLYLKLYTFTTKSKKGRLVITIALSMIFLASIVFSATYYPYGPLGASLFLAASFVAYFNFNENKSNNNLIWSAVFFILASFFRVEVFLTLLPIICYEIYLRRIKILSVFCFVGMVVVFISCLQNYIKFDDPFQNGIGLNHMLNNPSFVPISFEYFRSNFYGYFIDLPKISSSDNLGFLQFGFHGSEPGGYFSIKYTPLILGLITYIFSFIKDLFAREKIDWKTKNRPNAHNANGLICLLGGIMLLIFYVAAFNTSPKYDIIYAPILVVSGAYFFFRSNLINFCLLMLLVWMHISILLNFISVYPGEV